MLYHSHFISLKFVSIVVRGWLARKHFDDMLNLEDSNVEDVNKIKGKDSKIRQKVLLYSYLFMLIFFFCLLVREWNSLSLNGTFDLRPIRVMMYVEITYVCFSNLESVNILFASRDKTIKFAPHIALLWAGPTREIFFYLVSAIFWKDHPHSVVNGVWFPFRLQHCK